MKSFEELYKEFNNDEEINKIGKQAMHETNKQAIVAIFLCTAFVILYLFAYFYFKITDSLDHHTNAEFIIAIIFVCLFFSLILLTCENESSDLGKKQKKFVSVYKEKIIKKMINNFFDDVEYFPDKPMPKAVYDEGRYEPYDKYNSDDSICTKINKKYLMDICEILTTKKSRDSNGDITYTEVFHGLFTKIYIEKNINTDLRITYLPSEYDNKLEMDSNEFEELFNVYTSDQIKGMQILTADIMDEIIEFKNRTKRIFDIYINDDQIYLRFHCGRLFEPHFKINKILDENSLKSYYDILNFTCELTKKIIKAINDVEL